MLVVPNPDFWGVKPILKSAKRPKEPVQYDSDELSEGSITPPRDGGFGVAFPILDHLEDPLGMRELAERRRLGFGMAYRHLHTPRKQLAPRRPAAVQKERAKAATKDGPMHKPTGVDYEESVHAEQIGRVLSIGQYEYVFMHFLVEINIYFKTLKVNNLNIIMRMDKDIWRIISSRKL